jgi:hypothetical protein
MKNATGTAASAIPALSRIGTGSDVHAAIGAPIRIAAVVEDGGIGARLQRQRQPPRGVGQQDHDVVLRYTEDEHRDGEHEAAQHERHAPSVAVRDRAGWHLCEDDKEEERRIEQRDLRQGKVALLSQVDDPDRPPQLELHEEAIEVRLPDVGLEGHLLAYTPEQIHGPEYNGAAVAQTRSEGLVPSPSCQFARVVVYVYVKAKMFGTILSHG